jgi:hypothetical protein
MCPLGPWPASPEMKRLGQYMQRKACDGIRGIGWKMLRATGLSVPETEQLSLDVKRELTNPINRIYQAFIVVYGQKPLTS